ncbi:hypothetical protein SLJ66_004049 [Escherichia coli]|nr:hypothetical protein [Escherichia coli]
MKHELSNIIQSEVADFFAGFVEIHTELGGPNSIEEAQSQLSDRLCALLAGMEQEPVAWRYRFVHTPKSLEHGSYFTTDWVLTESEDDCNPSDCFERQPLFTHPAPIPAAVPDKLTERLYQLRKRATENGVYPDTIAWEDLVCDALKALDDCRAAMLQSGWIPVSERLPDVGDIVLTAIDGCTNVGEMERSGANYRYFTSVVSGRELPATH